MGRPVAPVDATPAVVTVAGWAVRTDVAGGVHVLPIDDVVGHELADECTCGPELEAVKRDNGGVGWLVSHHRLG